MIRVVSVVALTVVAMAVLGDEDSSRRQQESDPAWAQKIRRLNESDAMLNRALRKPRIVESFENAEALLDEAMNLQQKDKTDEAVDKVISALDCVILGLKEVLDHKEKVLESLTEKARVISEMVAEAKSSWPGVGDGDIGIGWKARITQLDQRLDTMALRIESEKNPRWKKRFKSLYAILLRQKIMLERILPVLEESRTRIHRRFLAHLETAFDRSLSCIAKLAGNFTVMEVALDNYLALRTVLVESRDAANLMSAVKEFTTELPAPDEVLDNEEDAAMAVMTLLSNLFKDDEESDSMDAATSDSDLPDLDIDSDIERRVAKARMVASSEDTDTKSEEEK